MADPFSESLDLLADGNTDFAEFSIDSFDDEDEEELNKFINGDLDDDDPLGILGERKQEPLPQKLVAEGEEQKSIDASTGTGTGTGTTSTPFALVADETQSAHATSTSNSTAGGVTNQTMDIPTAAHNNCAEYTPVTPSAAAESGSGVSTTTSSSNSSSSSSSTNTNNKLGSSSAVSALKKQAVAATEDPLSTTWTNPMSSGSTTTAPTIANANVSTAHNGTHLPYPNASHTVNPSNNPTVPMGSSTMGSSYMGTTGTGMGAQYNTADAVANLVSKTQSLTSTFSSFASKFQDAVSNAAIVANTSVNPIHPSGAGGVNVNVNASMQSTNTTLSRNQSGYSQQSMNRMHGAGGGGGGPIGVGNASVGMHGNHAVAAGIGNNTTNGGTGAVYYGAPFSAKSVSNANIANGGTGPATRVQDIDKTKRR